MKKTLQSPITLVFCTALGIVAGIYFPFLTPFLEPINDVYISLFQVCSLPIIIAALTISIGKLLKKEFHSVLVKWLGFSLIAVIMSALIGIATSVSMTKFLTPSDQDKITLTNAANDTNNKAISDSFSELKIYQKNDISNQNEFSLIEFLINTVPTNIFTALSENSTLQILTFFIILGIMLTFIEPKFSEPIIDLFYGISGVLSKFISILLYFLPASVFISMVTLFSNDNTLTILSSIVKFIIANYIAMISIIVLSAIIIFTSCKSTIKQHLAAIKRTFFLSIGTRSSSAVLPSTIEDFINENRSDEATVKSLLPIGTLFFGNGSIVSSAILAIYAMMIYGNQLDFKAFIFVALGAIVFSMSLTSGAEIAAILPVMFQPLGLPTDVIMIILIAAKQFYAGISTFVDIYSNLAITSLIAAKENKSRKNSQGIEVNMQHVD